MKRAANSRHALFYSQSPESVAPRGFGSVLWFPVCGSAILGSGPIPFGVCLVGILAAFDATTPENARYLVFIGAAIQPAVMRRAGCCVHSRLVDRVCMVRHSDERVVSVERIEANATT